MTKTITAKEVHEDFFGAEERLFVESTGLKSYKPDNVGRYAKLGFTACKPINDAYDKEKKAAVSDKVIETIVYFRQHYPQNKFITEAEVKALCLKYSLILGDAKNYIGDIPEKNLTEIENFKLRKEDYAEASDSVFDESRINWAIFDEPSHFWDAPKRAVYIAPGGGAGYATGLDVRDRAPHSDRVLASIMALEADPQTQGLLFAKSRRAGSRGAKQKIAELKVQYDAAHGKLEAYLKKPETVQPTFKICAPVKDFNTKNNPITGGYILEDDPVVLQPVRYKGIPGYLIVSVWGTEASDDKVIDENKN